MMEETRVKRTRNVPNMLNVFSVFASSVVLLFGKWPSWLTKQTEKQRLVLAYKVLFLDVLFPTSVPKIIYIDADQVRFSTSWFMA